MKLRQVILEKNCFLNIFDDDEFLNFSNYSNVSKLTFSRSTVFLLGEGFCLKNHSIIYRVLVPLVKKSYHRRT